jgi:predicted HTH domain antitoxin
MDESYIQYLSRIQKVILMLLFVDGTPIKGKTWFQKEVFLISKLDEQIQEEIEFKPHNYGPHSYEAEDALENLEEESLIEIIGNSEIRLTSEGEKVAKLLKKEFSNKNLNFYKEIKDFLNDLSKMELLAFIYQTNKDMTTQSVELENVKRRLLEYSISLYKKEKLSLVKSSEISGLKIEEFIKELNKRGVKISTGI